MKTLKKGSKGAEVKELQSKLKDLGFYGSSVDGSFGPLTEAAVVAFQKSKKLKADGIVGLSTWAALDVQVQDSDVLDSGTVKPPKSYSEVYSTFGDPLKSGWSAANLAFCEVPASLKAFPLVKGKRGFYCHKKLVPAFGNVFKDIDKAGLAKEIYSFDGCFNIRKIRGGSALSLHSWAIAIDLNYEGNELGNSNPQMPKSIVNIFAKHKFYWGGYFRRKDGMHFEYFGRS